VYKDTLPLTLPLHLAGYLCDVPLMLAGASNTSTTTLR
jgi:hypothetical protein